MNENRMAAGSLLTGVGIGAAVMYLLDPELGTSRRALALDQVTKTRKMTRDAAETTARDLSNRTKGIAAATWSRVRPQSVNDDVLAERVRSKLGFLVRHPSAIEVSVGAGRVTLGGPVLADEVRQLLRGVRRVRGVTDVIDYLDVHEEADDVPELQGGKPKPSGEVWDVLQAQWSPATRFLVGITSLGLIGFALCQGLGSSLPRLLRHRRAPIQEPELPRNPQGTPSWLG